MFKAAGNPGFAQQVRHAQRTQLLVDLSDLIANTGGAT
jgi:hypothetical protein